MSAGKKVISRPHALFSYSAPKKTQMSESESVNDVIRSTSQKKSDSETMMERKTGTPVKKQQTINNTPPVHKMNNIRRSQSAYTLERTPVKQESLPPRPSSEVRTLQSKVKMSPRGNRVENNSNEQLTRRLIGSGQSPNIRIPQQSPRKIHDVDRTPQSPRSLRTPQSPRFLKTSRDSRNIPTSLPKTNASEKKTVKREFPQSGIVQIKTSVRTIHTIKDDSDTDGNFITPNNSTPLTHNVKYIRAQFEKSNVKPPPSPTPSKHRVRFNENVQMYVERSSSSPEITPTRKSSVDNSVATNRTELRGIRTPSCKTGNVQDHISSGHEPSAGTFLRKSCLRRSLSDHCLDTMRKKNTEYTPLSSQKRQNRIVLDSVTPDCFSPVLLDTCQKSHSCENLPAEVEDGETANLIVGVRVRPPNPGEYEAVRVADNSIQIETDQNTRQCFNYDYCFTSVGPQAASQEHVYNTMVKPLVNTAFDGYNVCMFAYGQTGSGKSYSMMGLNDGAGDSMLESTGIIPRFCNDLLTRANMEKYYKTTVYLSYFEIYNEKIHDLLAPSNVDRKTPLRVREHPKLGPYVVGLTTHKVNSFSDVQDCLYFGDLRRMSAATGMNENSSRSHSIFTITLSQAQSEDELDEFSPAVRSKVNLVDLAGSERVAQTCASGDRLREGVSINRSLLTLGKVINCLAENRRGFVPYRESLLTWLLKESLGGNSRTVMLATISPGSAYVEESLATLRYACQASSIINTIHINETPQERSIREMSEELERLRQVSINKGDTDLLMSKLSTAEDEIGILKKRLDEVMDELNEVQRLNTVLENERDSLVQQKFGLENDNMTVKNEILSLENINKALISEKNDLEKESVNLKERNTCFLNENMMLVKEKVSLVKEKVRLEQENMLLKKKIVRLEEDKVKMEKEKAKLVKERRSFEKIKIVLEKQNLNLMEEKAEIEKHISEKENLNVLNRKHIEKEQSDLHEKIRKLEEELLLCKKENFSLNKLLKIEKRKNEKETNRVNVDIETQMRSLITDFSHTKERITNYMSTKEQTNDEEKEELRKANDEMKLQLDQQQQMNSFLRKQIEERVNRIQEGFEDIIPDPEQMHEAFIEAADICTRLQLPYVFHSEPEVTTDMWFPVNVRVYDLHQGTSVRWTQCAFLSWLKSMKDNITSNSRGRILFKDALWLQNEAVGSACSSPCVGMSPSRGLSAKKERPLRNEVSNVKMQIAALENLRGFNNKRELQTAVTSLGEALQNLSSSLGVRGQVNSCLKFATPSKDTNMKSC